MKNIQATIYLLLTSFFIMSSAQAHDPSERPAFDYAMKFVENSHPISVLTGIKVSVTPPTLRVTKAKKPMTFNG